MLFVPSARYIKSIRRRPRRIVLMLVGVSLIFGCATFFGTKKTKEHQGWSFLFAVFLVGGIGSVQIWRGRKLASQLATVSYKLLDDGISVEWPSSSYVIPYDGIRGVVLRRGSSKDEIDQICLKGSNGDALLPELEAQDLFIQTFRQRIGSVPYTEK